LKNPFKQKQRLKKQNFLFLLFYNGRRIGLSGRFGEVFIGLDGERESGL